MARLSTEEFPDVLPPEDLLRTLSSHASVLVGPGTEMSA